jgi:hypothetical protein
MRTETQNQMCQKQNPTKHQTGINSKNPRAKHIWFKNITENNRGQLKFWWENNRWWKVYPLLEIQYTRPFISLCDYLFSDVVTHSCTQPVRNVK